MPLDFLLDGVRDQDVGLDQGDMEVSEVVLSSKHDDYLHLNQSAVGIGEGKVDDGCNIACADEMIASYVK